MTRITRKLLGAPVAALGAAGLLVGGGGYALAASQGAVHVPFTGHDNRSAQAPAAPSDTNPGLSKPGPTAAPGADDLETVDSGDAETPDATATPAANPSPSLVGLCRAYQAGAVKEGKSNPAFDALTAAAGTADNVSTYCVDLVGPPKKPAHPAKPTQAAEPSKGKPTSVPTRPAKPTQAAEPSKGKPTSAPTHAAPRAN